MGIEGIIPISLKRERKSAQPEFARAMRSPEGRASAEQPPPAAAAKAPCFHTQAPTANSRPHAATEIIGDRRKLIRIAEQVRNPRTVAPDIETYGERRGDGLDPWNGDIRLLSLCVEYGGSSA
jgi:hypothetical protein